MWDWLAKKSSKAVQRAYKASRSWVEWLRDPWGRSPKNPTNELSDIYKLYTTDPIIYAGVWILATTVAKIPIVVRDADGEVITGHPLVKLVNHPNSDQSRQDLIESVQTYLSLGGESFIEKVRDNGLGRPRELYSIRPSDMQIIPGDENRKIRGYFYSPNGTASYDYDTGEVHGEGGAFFDAADIIYTRYFDPLDSWRGHGQIQTLAEGMTVSTEDNADRWMNRFMERHGAKEGYLTTDADVGEEEARALARMWNTGQESGRGTPFLPSDIKFQPYSETPKQSGLIEIRNFNRQLKLSVLGVPPVKIGLLEFARYASYDLQNKSFFVDTIETLLQKLCGSMTRSLLTEYEDPRETGNYVSYNVVKSSFANLPDFIEAVGRVFDRNGLSVNELIELTGWGDKLPEAEGNKRFADLFGSGQKPDTGGSTDSQNTEVSEEPSDGDRRDNNDDDAKYRRD